MSTTLRDEVWEDLRWYGAPSLSRLVVCCYRSRTFRPVLTLRLAQHSPSGLRRAAHLAHRWACTRAGIDLPVQTRIGPGFKLTHGWGVVVSGRAVIGEDVILMHGVTIGTRGKAGEAPTLGDRVFVGPNAAVLGGVTIGAGATISAGCVIVHDVAADTLVTTDHTALRSRRYVRPLEKGVGRRGEGPQVATDSARSSG